MEALKLALLCTNLWQCRVFQVPIFEYTESKERYMEVTLNCKLMELKMMVFGFSSVLNQKDLLEKPFSDSRKKAKVNSMEMWELHAVLMYDFGISLKTLDFCFFHICPSK